MEKGNKNADLNASRNTALFVCGETPDGALVKFRWYERKDFIGVQPTAEAIARWDSPWLLGCILSKDGAADLVCAVPLRGIGNSQTVTQDVEEEQITPENEKEGLPLDDIIRRANQNRYR